MRKGPSITAIPPFLAALCIAASAHAAPVNLNIQLNGYLPAPPGVQIHVQSGRPYYIEHDRRVYLVKKSEHDRGKHRGHGKKHGHR